MLIFGELICDGVRFTAPDPSTKKIRFVEEAYGVLYHKGQVLQSKKEIFDVDLEQKEVRHGSYERTKQSLGDRGSGIGPRFPILTSNRPVGTAPRSKSPRACGPWKVAWY